VWIPKAAWKGSDGYLYVGGGGSKSVGVHIFVLLAWKGLPAPGQQCRHLDNNRTNNVLGNLLWGTRKENEADKKIHGTDNGGEKHYAALLTDKQAAACREIRRRHPGKSGVVWC
jgi:hypothetical protein